jgi:hypothetical protein
MIKTWYVHWYSYDNKWDWPMYNGPIIKSDPVKINKWKRKKICIPMVIDEMEDRINRLPTRGRARSSKIWFRLHDVVLYFIIIARTI